MRGERVGMIYRRNFLKKVICKADFPINLRLGEERPVEFQEKTATVFPKTLESVLVETHVKARAIPSAEVKEPILRWEFYTRNTKKKVTLQRDFLMMEDEDFKHFKDFKGYFDSAFEALVAVYNPPIITRLGLRYQNLIKLTAGEPFDWVGFVHPSLISHVGFEHSGEQTADDHLLRVKRERSQVILRYGVHNSAFPAPIRERQFGLDIDCFMRDDIELTEVDDRLRVLNEEAVDIFESSIGESWRNLMMEGDEHD